MNLNTNLIEGNLAAGPTLIYTPNTQTPIAEAVVLINRRTKNPASQSAGEWGDAEPTRHRIKAYHQLAENMATLPKGALVLIIGHTETSSWIDTPTQTKHTAGIVVVDAIGASLRHTTVTIEPTHGQSASAAEQGA